MSFRPSAHDDRFDAFVNKLDLIGKDQKKMEVIAITDTLNKKSKTPPGEKKGPDGKGTHGFADNGGSTPATATQMSLQFQVGEIERALYAKIVKKCGNRNHWEDWANDIAKIAQTHILRITQIVSDPKNTKEAAAFTAFANELRDDLNDSITDPEVIEMLAQHLITKPVFDALFKDYSFASNNPVSLAMQQVLDVLHEHRLGKEADTLERFYASVAMRADGIDSAEGKQKIVVELYDKFFRNAFPRMTERLGIVYTPVEVVDFIIHSINDLLQSEFGQTLGSKGVHIIDPFTGTGTFITRLLQSGLISKDQLPHKYKNEIHANEIVLLAYYIAAINIEAVYHSLVGGKYEPFEGICLTDTFRLGEEDLVSGLLANNSDRRKRQQKLEVRVIMANPPYSVGQESANDDNENVSYPALDGRIRETYAKHSTSTLQRALYDSYIRAIRWASDRLGKSGIIGFVTNAGFVDAKTADGLRKCLAEEFSSIYVFHLRGNQRTSGELSRREGGKIFGSGSRAPIAITLLAKNQQVQQNGQIYWHDIGDYLTQQEKLSTINKFGSINGIKEVSGWTTVTPDAHNDWINQRDGSFDNFLVLSSKKAEQPQIFSDYSNGVKTNRDAWCYNYSKKHLSKNVSEMIQTYNSELELSEEKPDHRISQDPSRISWSSGLVNHFERKRRGIFRPEKLRKCLYRPFSQSWGYLDSFLNDRPGQMPKIFPDGGDNIILWATGVGASVPFSCWISATICGIQQGPAAVQHFPLYLYEQVDDIPFSDDLFPAAEGEIGMLQRRDAITNDGLTHFQKAYPGETITKEDLFYYIYGLLHSPDYRNRYADNLSKELPRIPAVKTFADFRAFSQAGRDLAHWHLNYETVEPYAGVEIEESVSTSFDYHEHGPYRVTKMRFAKKRDPETNKSINDKTTVIYNEYNTIRNIPLEAYDYIVNGKPALEWVMERQSITTDKDSGITNDANLWATETMQNPRYPLELFLRVINVSIESLKIVNGLPQLAI